MDRTSEFARVEVELRAVLEELRPMEPIFHTAAFGRTVSEFDDRMSPHYWEVGASGRRYSRSFILKTLADNPPVDAASAGWVCRDFGIERLGTETFLLTYTLLQERRLTRRATIWTQPSGRWRILFHQGTIVSAEEDDRAPL